MRAWILVCTAAVGAILAGPRDVNGQILERIASDTCEANSWPHPHYCPDRHAVRSVFQIHTEAGWQAQNLLAGRHFKPETGELTPLGRDLVHWIAIEAPSQRRTIYVRRTDSKDETQARLASVQRYLASFPMRGSVPQVVETHISPPGYPAGFPTLKDMAGRRFRDNAFGSERDLYLPDREIKTKGD